MLGGDKLKVDRVHNGPDLPGTLDGSEEIALDLVANGGERVAVDETQVSKEDRHEDRAPEELVNGDLERNVLGLRSFDLLVEPVVKVVSRRAVVDETKDGESDETLHVERSAANEKLAIIIFREMYYI